MIIACYDKYNNYVFYLYLKASYNLGVRRDIDDYWSMWKIW